ncbi:hypothetical protein HDU81_010783, partial [Chytriomyces hyalinus]
VTFGANLSIAAGPVGRSAEGAGSVANLAPIYSYSKTKGLFAGVSFEGLVIITRKETNARFYGGISGTATPQDLLSGRVPPPPEAEVLYRALNARGFGSNMDPGGTSPVSNGGSISSGLGGRQSMGASGGSQPLYPSAKKGAPPPPPPHPSTRQTHSASTSQTFPPPPPQAPPKPMLLQKKQPPSLPPHPVTSTLPAYAAAAASASANNSTTGKVPPRPSPTSLASANNASQTRLTQQPPVQPPALPAKHPMSIKSVTALYDFDGQRAGDLSFIAGDRIVVLKDQGEWWEGELKGVKGVFPCNYVQ